MITYIDIFTLHIDIWLLIITSIYWSMWIDHYTSGSFQLSFFIYFFWLQDALIRHGSHVFHRGAMIMTSCGDICHFSVLSQQHCLVQISTGFRDSLVWMGRWTLVHLKMWVSVRLKVIWSTDSVKAKRTTSRLREHMWRVAQCILGNE